jgi:hypothetical protein
MTDHLIQMSGGTGSWATARRVRDSWYDEDGDDTMTLLFADTLIEDADLYRFLIEAACDIIGIDPPAGLLAACERIPRVSLDTIDDRKAFLAKLQREANEQVPGLMWVSDGRTPWETFYAKRYLGNSLVDPCSTLLKRELLRAWIEDHREPDDTIVHLGIDWSEIHRFEKAKPNWIPWRVEAPLTEKPLIGKAEINAALRERDIELPRLTALGFPHNNCGGFCVKAGMGQFVHLLRNDPELFAYHEEEERRFRAWIQKDVTILHQTRGGVKHFVSLQELRERTEAGEQLGRDMSGGCGCAID